MGSLKILGGSNNDTNIIVHLKHVIAIASRDRLKLTDQTRCVYVAIMSQDLFVLLAAQMKLPPRNLKYRLLSEIQVQIID